MVSYICLMLRAATLGAWPERRFTLPVSQCQRGSKMAKQVEWQTTVFEMVLPFAPIISTAAIAMSDLLSVTERALSSLTPFRVLTGAGLGFSTFIVFANLGGARFGVLPMVNEPAVRRQLDLPIGLAVRQWAWFFAKAMVSGSVGWAERGWTEGEG